MTAMSNPVLLSSGYAAPDAFPGEALADIASDILRTRTAEALQYGKREGYMPLRELIAEWLVADRVDASPEDVSIITGAKQGLDIVARGLCAPGDSIMLSEPTYMNGLKIFRSAGLNVIGVSCDEQGTDVDAVERTLAAMKAAGRELPRVFYEIPDFHNPTGRVLPEDRREQLVAVAEKYGMKILEDNPYVRLRYDGTPTPPLKHFDRSGTVVSVGSFAKILGPGLQLGWIHASREVIDRVSPLKADAGTSPLCQMMAHELFRPAGAFRRHLDFLKVIYRARREEMLSALGAEFPNTATWSNPQGGYYIWASVPGIDTDELVDPAGEAGVVFYRGSVFFASDNAPSTFMRLGFCYEPPDRIRQGIETLGRLIKQRLQ